MVQKFFLRAFLLPWRCSYMWFLCKYLYWLIYFFHFIYAHFNTRNNFKRQFFKKQFQNIGCAWLWLDAVKHIRLRSLPICWNNFVSTVLLLFLHVISALSHYLRGNNTKRALLLHSNSSLPSLWRWLCWEWAVRGMGCSTELAHISLIVFSYMNGGRRQSLIFLPLNGAQIFNYPLILSNTLISCYMIDSMAIKSFHALLHCIHIHLFSFGSQRVFIS